MEMHNLPQADTKVKIRKIRKCKAKNWSFKTTFLIIFQLCWSILWLWRHSISWLTNPSPPTRKLSGTPMLVQLVCYASFMVWLKKNHWTNSPPSRRISKLIQGPKTATKTGMAKIISSRISCGYKIPRTEESQVASREFEREGMMKIS